MLPGQYHFISPTTNYIRLICVFEVFVCVCVGEGKQHRFIRNAKAAHKRMEVIQQHSIINPANQILWSECEQ